MSGRDVHRKMVNDLDDDESEYSESEDSEDEPGFVECLRTCCESVTKPVGRCMGRTCGYGYSSNLPEDCELGGRDRMLGHLGKIARLVYGQGYTNDEYYGKLDPPFCGEGWEVVDQVVEAHGSGKTIQAGCYVRADGLSDVAVVAFRGTSSKKGGVQCADLRFVKGKKIGRAVEDAVEFYEKCKAAHPDKEIYITGHSLGGYIAEACASFVDAPGASWNSPGPWHTTGLRNHTGPYRPCYEVHLTREDPLSFVFPKPENSSHIGKPIWHRGKNHRICKPYMCRVEDMKGVYANSLRVDKQELLVDQREALEEMGHC